MKKLILTLALTCCVSQAIANELILALMTIALHERPAPQPTTQVMTGSNTKVEVGFSPEGSGEALVLKIIQSAEKDLKVMAYSFTSPTVTKALINAKRRGVEVAVLANENNIENKAGQAALSALVEAGISVRTIDVFAIFHDKSVLSDYRHVQTGSFNYSKAASQSNSENVIVLWNAPEVVAPYLNHWNNRWVKGKKFKQRY